MKHILITLIFFCQLPLIAQSPKDTVTMTIDDCIEYAVANSFKTNIQKTRTEDQKMAYNQAIMNHLPSISGGVGLETAFGRGVDPETNSYVNQSNLSNSYSLSGNIPIFQGLSILNQTRKAKISKLRGETELTKVKDDVAIETILAFAEAVYKKEIMILYSQMIEKYNMELKKASRKYGLGAGSQTDVAQIKARLSQEKLVYIEAKNHYEISLIKLKDQMNFPLEQDLALASAEEELLRVQYPEQSVEQVIAFALESNPKSQISRQTVDEEKLSLSIARGQYYPSISLSGGINTAFFRQLDGDNYTSFSNQFNNNLGQWVGVTLSIPIFDRNRARHQVKMAKSSLKRAILTNEQDDRLLRSEIRQALMELSAAEQTLELARYNVKYQSLANEAVAKKYEKGLSSIIELQTSDSDLFKSQLELRNAILKYQIKIREVNYYKGVPFYNRGENRNPQQ